VQAFPEKKGVSLPTGKGGTLLCKVVLGKGVQSIVRSLKVESRFLRSRKEGGTSTQKEKNEVPKALIAWGTVCFGGGRRQTSGIWEGVQDVAWASWGGGGGGGKKVFASRSPFSLPQPGVTVSRKRCCFLLAKKY